MKSYSEVKSTPNFMWIDVLRDAGDDDRTNQGKETGVDAQSALIGFFFLLHCR